MIFNTVKNTEAPIAMKPIWTHCIEVMYYSAQQKMIGMIENMSWTNRIFPQETYRKKVLYV